MVDQRRVVDVAHRHAVMVDDDDALALFVDLLAFQQALLVGIDDDQQRIRRDDVERLIGCDKVVALACIKKSLEQRPGERSLAVDGDDRGHFAHFADAQHADGGADGVEVTHAVPHDDNAVAALDEVAQRIGNNAAADVAALLDAVGDTTVELKAVNGLNGGLVAAAAQGNVDALACHLVAFLQGLSAVADTDGQRGQPAGMQRTDLIEDVKALRQHPADVTLLHHCDVSAVRDLAQKAGAAPDVFLQQAVDGLQLLGLLTVLHIVKQLVIAVDDDDETGRAALVVLVERFFIKRIIDEIHKAGPAAALG